MKKAFLNWSSGKDAAFAFYKVLLEKEYKVEKLFTTITEPTGLVTIHGVPVELVEKQAESLNLPLHKVSLKDDMPMDAYSAVMQKEFQKLAMEGITHSIYGDIFLEDIRIFREGQLAELRLTGVFPLWKENTRQLIHDFISLGFKAIVVCVNAKVLDSSFCGRVVDESFLNDLPDNVDPCGENGEYHTFVFDGPIFRFPIDFGIGELYEKKAQDPKAWDTHFYYRDIFPK